MHTRSTIIAILLAFTVVLPLAGCGDNDNNNNTNDNQTGDPTRTPTPGRTATVVVATSTPVVATSTPIVSPGEPTPTATEGPVATVTATGGVATATGGVPTPTPTSTPGGGAVCQTGEHVMVTASLNKAFAAFVMTIAYPDSVLIPGSGQSLGNRVVFSTTGGFTTASDDDDIGGDGVDDTLHASFASGADLNPGAVLTATFDCVPGQSKPAAGAFTCGVNASTCAGTSPCDPETIPDAVCSVQVR